MLKRKGVQIMFIGILFTAALILCGQIETTYTRDAVVISVEQDEVTVEDATGNIWEFYGDDFFVGEEVILTMDNNNTDNNIFDDFIKDVEKRLDK